MHLGWLLVIRSPDYARESREARGQRQGKTRLRTKKLNEGSPFALELENVN